MKTARIMLLGFVVSCSCRALTFRVESVSARPGESLSLRVYVEDAEQLGHVLFDLAWPAGALEVRQTVPGDMAAARPADEPADGADFLTRTWYDRESGQDVFRFGWLYGSGYSGTGTVLVLGVTVDDRRRQEIPLDLSLLDAVEAGPGLATLEGGTVSGRIRIVVDAGTGRILRVVTPASGSVVPAEAAVSIRAEVTGGAPEAVTVFFYGDGALLGSGQTEPYVLDWESVPPGLHTVSVEAEDALGTVIPGDEALFTVLDRGPQTSEDWTEPAADWFCLTGNGRERAETELAWRDAPGYLDDDGYAEIDLGALAPVSGAYLAAYTTAEASGFAHFADAEVRVALNDLDSAQVPVGGVRFFAGEFGAAGEARFYVYREPFAAVTYGQWQAGAVVLSPDPERWVGFGEPDRVPAGMLDAPQVWGLAVVAAESGPSGLLGLDGVEVRFRAEATAFLDLDPGWNLRSVPVMPRETLGEMLGGTPGTPTVSAWEWSTAEGAYRVVGPGSYLRPGQGYWLYAHGPEPRVLDRLRGPLGRARDGGEPGWELFGPPVEQEIPSSDVVRSVWGWHRSRYFPVDGQASGLPPWQAPERMMQTRGYWLLRR